MKDRPVIYCDKPVGPERKWCDLPLGHEGPCLPNAYRQRIPDSPPDYEKLANLDWGFLDEGRDPASACPDYKEIGHCMCCDKRDILVTYIHARRMSGWELVDVLCDGCQALGTKKS